MAATMYNIAYDVLSSGGATDWTTSTIKCLLLTSTYVFDATDVYITDLSNELAGGGYVRITLGAKTRTLGVSGEVLTTSTFISFGTIAAAAGTPGWLVLADATTGVDATSPVLGCFLMPGTPGNGVDDYQVTPPADGLFLLGPVGQFTLPEMLTFKSGS